MDIQNFDFFLNLLVIKMHSYELKAHFYIRIADGSW